jgi:flagellar assembly factor FliW
VSKKKNNKGSNNIILGLTPYEGDLTKSLTQEDIFDFPEGLPAFEEARHFSLITTEDIKPFMYLKSLEIEDLGFVCIDPFLLSKDYLVKISAADLAILQIKEPKHALVFCFVTVKEDPQENSANLLAPIIINIQNRVGKQVILENYPVKFNIWEGLDQMSGDESC